MSNDLSALLVSEPRLYIVGRTEFVQDGLNEWANDRGFFDDSRYLGSPLQNIVSGGTMVTDDQAPSELMAELAGRFCYNSFMKGRSSEDYLKNVIDMAHGSVLEHVSFNFIIEGVSRALTHELIRHRAGFGVSQESQRYVDAKDIRFVIPPLLLAQCGGDLNHERIQEFAAHCEVALQYYKKMQADYSDVFGEPDSDGNIKIDTMAKKRANEAARAVLPNAAETKLMWTGNIRALRHLVELRGDSHADLEIRRLAVAIAEKMIDASPYSFFDTETYDADHGVGIVKVGAHKV